MNFNFNIEDTTLHSLVDKNIVYQLFKDGYTKYLHIKYLRSKLHGFMECLKKENHFCITDFLNKNGKVFAENTDILFVMDKEEESVLVFTKKDYSTILKFLETYQEYFDFSSDSRVQITYFYMSGGLRDERINLENTGETIYTELYPTIDINNLNIEFKGSNENILILYGIPGVGKTTFLKYMLHTGFYKKVAYVKDKDVMKSGEFWAMITSDEYELLIFDDLDDALEPRQKNENDSFLNNLLSYSNGVFNQTCKIVITTNQTIHSIDPAIIRPGRCFDFLVLEPLTWVQARDFWVDILKQSDESFEKRFGVVDTITQASLISEFLRIKSGDRYRSYNKSPQKYYSIDQKIHDLGISSDSNKRGGFKA